MRIRLYVLLGMGALVVAVGFLVWRGIWHMPQRVYTYTGISRSVSKHTAAEENYLRGEISFSLGPNEETLRFEKLTPSEDGYIVSITAEASSRVVEHVDVYDPSSHDIACSEFPLHLFGMSGGGADLILPRGYGIPITKGEPLSVSLYLRNSSEDPVSGDVHISIQTVHDARPLTPIVVSVGDYCSEKNTSLTNPFLYSIESIHANPVRIPAQARIIGWMGDVSGNVSDIVLSQNAKEISNAKHEEPLVDVSQNPITINSGDTLTLTAKHRETTGTAYGVGYLYVDFNNK